MQLHLVLPMLGVGSCLLTLAPASAVEIFTSQSGSAVKSPACVPTGGSKTFDLWVDPESNGTPAKPCNGTADDPPGSDALCMSDYFLSASGDLTIDNYDDGGLDVVFNRLPASLRFNFGDPIDGWVARTQVGSITVSGTGPSGNVDVMGEQTVNTALQGDAVQQITLIGSGAAVDQDDDGFCDAPDENSIPQDPCPITFNAENPAPGQAFFDINQDGVPDECQCGDANGTGAYESADLLATFNCLSSDPTAQFEPCATTIIQGDTNNTGNFESADLLSTFRFLTDATGSWELTCAARPSGTDPNAPAP